MEETNTFEAAPRVTQPDWAVGGAGRMPLKLPSGTLKAPIPRPPLALSARFLPLPPKGKNDEFFSTSETKFKPGNGAKAAVVEIKFEEGHTTNPPPLDSPLAYSVSSYLELLALPPSTILARREARRMLIADLSQHILSNPEHSVLPPKRGGEGGRDGVCSLMHLHRLCSDPDPAVRTLALPSLGAVFADIVPSYRIRESAPEGEVGAGVQLKRDTMDLRKFESALLAGYQRALRLMEFLVREGESASSGGGMGAPEGKSFERDQVSDGTGAPSSGVITTTKDRVSKKEWDAGKREEKEAAQAVRDGLVPYLGSDVPTRVALGRTALKTLCFLLTRLPHFNFMPNLVGFLVPRLAKGEEASCAIVEEGIAQALKGDSVGDAGLEVARVVSRISKESTIATSGRRVRVNLLSRRSLSVLRASNLAEILERRDDSREDTSGDTLSRRKKGKTTEQLAAEADILSGLKAADAEALEKRRATAKTTLRNIFTAYFRVLRAGSTHFHLLPDVLAGVADFSHLVDVGVVGDVVAALKELIAGGGRGGRSGGDEILTPLPVLFSCATSALRILSGPGRELLGGEGDGGAIAKAVFSALIRCISPGEDKHIPSAILATSALLLDRQEYCLERVGAFAHRLSYLAVSANEVSHATALTSLVRAVCVRYALVGRSLLCGGGTTKGVGGYPSLLPPPSLTSFPETTSTTADPDTAVWLQSPLFCLAPFVSSSHFHPAVTSLTRGMFVVDGEGGGKSKGVSWEPPLSCLILFRGDQGDFNPLPTPVPSRPKFLHSKGFWKGDKPPCLEGVWQTGKAFDLLPWLSGTCSDHYAWKRKKVARVIAQAKIGI